MWSGSNERLPMARLPLTLFCPREREHPTLPDAPQLWSPGNPTFPAAEFEAETLTVSLLSELLRK